MILLHSFFCFLGLLASAFCQENSSPLLGFSSNFDRRSPTSGIPLVRQRETPTSVIKPVVPSRVKVNDFIVFHRLAERKCMEYSGDDSIYENRTKTDDKGIPVTRRFYSCPGPRVFHTTVVGGKAAAPKQYPHMALVGYGPNVETVQWQCGGSIISLRFVLTAAHCINTRSGPPTYVRVGDLDYGKATDDAAPQTIAVARSVPHDGYRRGFVYNDIALLELVRNIVVSVYARPACLNTDPDIIATEPMIATGWGHTELLGNNNPELMEVDLELFSASECAAIYKPAKTLPNGINADSQMCAGSRLEIKDTCNGDSGGPLQIYHKDISCMFKIVGVTSFGQGCGVIGVPGVYTRVSNFIEWIEGLAFVHG